MLQGIIIKPMTIVIACSADILTQSLINSLTYNIKLKAGILI